MLTAILRRHLLALLIACCAGILCAHIGCSLPIEEAAQEPADEQDGTTLSDQRIQRSFGTYVITDHARCRGGLTSESWAKEKVGKVVILTGEICDGIGTEIHDPQYLLRDFPRMAEGEVPQGEQRALSDFFGFGTARDVITVLSVVTSDAGEEEGLNFEVIDSSTLWIIYDAWLFQLRLRGTESEGVPLARWK